MPHTIMNGPTVDHKFENDLANVTDQSSCKRCGGLFVEGYCLDVNNPEGQLWITTKKCIQCGNVIDPIILKNQEASRTHFPEAERTARPRPSYGVSLRRRKP